MIQGVVSEEAKVFREHFCHVIADVLYTWILNIVGKISSNSQVILGIGTGGRDFAPPSRSSHAYDSLWTDRRLKVIFGKMLKSARRKPKLMLKFYWTAFVMFVTASALACHRAVVSLSDAYFDPASFPKRQYAIST